MFYHLSGTLALTGEDYAVIDCGGVGFKCTCSSMTLKQLPPTGRPAKLYTYLNVKEDALDLFGFAEQTELELFKMLVSVSGVGPKSAIAMLGQGDSRTFAGAIVSSDLAMLTRAPGIGKRTAERIVVELRDKIANHDLIGQLGDAPAAAAGTPISESGEAADALMALGFTRMQAQRAVSQVAEEGMDIDQILRKALMFLSAQ